MESKPVKLKVGDKLVKRRGRSGPVRTVKKVYSNPAGVAVEWTQQTKRNGKEILEKYLGVDLNGLPHGYCFESDRQARKAVRK